MINKKIMLKPQKKTSGSLHRLTIASSYTEFGYIEGEGGAIKPNSFVLNGRTATITDFWSWLNSNKYEFYLGIKEPLTGNVSIKVNDVDLKGQIIYDEVLKRYGYSGESVSVFNYLKNNLGKTVDVWIDGGGLKRFLHRLFAILCGDLCYAEQENAIGCIRKKTSYADIRCYFSQRPKNSDSNGFFKKWKFCRYSAKNKKSIFKCRGFLSTVHKCYATFSHSKFTKDWIDLCLYKNEHYRYNEGCLPDYLGKSSYFAKEALYA